MKNEEYFVWKYGKDSVCFQWVVLISGMDIQRVSDEIQTDTKDYYRIKRVKYFLILCTSTYSWCVQGIIILHGIVKVYSVKKGEMVEIRVKLYTVPFQPEK